MRAGVALTLGPPSETDRASPVRPRREDEYCNAFPLTLCVFLLTLCVLCAIIINVREISPQGRKVGVFMKRNELVNWSVSSYNEGTDDQLDYFINERKCEVGDKAYLFSHDDKELTEMEIVHIEVRSNDIHYYDSLGDDVLCEREEGREADSRAEFITDNDCYCVWFKYSD